MDLETLVLEIQQAKLVKLARMITIDNESLTITVGTCAIKIDFSGIALWNGPASIKLTPGGMVSINGAMVSINGGIVSINDGALEVL